MNKFDITKHEMLHDNVLIKAVKPVEKKSGLIDPDQYEDKSEWGEVISIGPGRLIEGSKREIMSVKVGDIVLYGKYSTYKTRINGQDFLILRETDIMTRHG